MNNSALNALNTVFRESIDSIINVICELSDIQLLTVVDDKTDNEDTRSIQSILTHILFSGHRYIDYLSIHFSLENKLAERIVLTSVEAYRIQLIKLKENFELLLSQLNDSDLDGTREIKTNWNQTYDVEQLIEHAIVHNIRHLIQIKRYKGIIRQGLN